jgi:hypothetical protein
MPKGYESCHPLKSLLYAFAPLFACLIFGRGIDSICQLSNKVPLFILVQVAACLMGSAFGFRVMSRAQEDAAKIKSVGATMFESLESPWLWQAA